MARIPISKPHAAPSPSDSDHHSRKRVGKACDRCRLKKSKCNGTSPCLRCQQDNAICVFGERKRAHDKQYPKGYVEMLEGQQQQLVTGLQELYKMAATSGWSGAPLELTANGHPLTHDILDRLGLLKHGSDDAAFEEDFDVMQQKLIRGGAAMHSHSNSHSDDDDDDMSDTASSPVPRKRSPKHRRNQSVQQNSFSSASSGDIDSPATPPTPVDLLQTASMPMVDDVMANYNVMRMARQTWPQPQQLAGLSLQQQQQLQQQVYSATTDDSMDFMYKSPMAFQQPALSMDGLYDDGSLMGSLGMQTTLVAPLPEMSLDEFFLQ